MIVLTFAITGTAAAQSDPDAGTRATILALERLWMDAFANKDTKAVDSILDNSILLVNSDGSTQTKGDFLAGLKDRFAQASSPPEHIILESMSVKVFGTTAIATGVYQIKGIERSKPYLRRERFVDTWKYRTGLWLIIGTQATPVLH